MTRFLLLFEPLSRAIAAHVAVAFLLLFAAPAVAAAAQTRPQPVPVALSNVRLLSESADESRFELAFDPTATSFAPIASQPTQPSIGFPLPRRAPPAPAVCRLRARQPRAACGPALGHEGPRPRNQLRAGGHGAHHALRR